VRLTTLLAVTHVLSGSAPQASDVPRRDRVAELVTGQLGDAPTACARFKYRFIRGKKPTKQEVAALQSCMAKAYDAGESFYFSIEGSGVDSYVATGLMRAGSGTLQRFWYDSAPCGGPGCPERFHFATCASPPKPGRIDPWMECPETP
jgi:hypothetical protein